METLEASHAQTQPDEYGKQENKELGCKYVSERVERASKRNGVPKKIFQSTVEREIRKQIIIFIE